MLSHARLLDVYRLNFSLMQHHKWSLTELEEMIPWEREVYVSLMMDHIAKENEKNG